MTITKAWLTRVRRGAPWSRLLRVHAGDLLETPISIVGATVGFYFADEVTRASVLALEATEGGAAVAGIAFNDAAGGRFTLSLTPAQTAGFTPERLTIEVWIALAGQEAEPYVPGTMIILPTVRP